ncbi:hypothetical protein [Novosphingobium sp. SG707]|nr:hypothetical protein [Novosphingobium sp. SG707]
MTATDIAAAALIPWMQGQSIKKGALYNGRLFIRSVFSLVFKIVIRQR